MGVASQKGNQDESPSERGPLGNPFEKTQRPHGKKSWKVLSKERVCAISGG